MTMKNHHNEDEEQSSIIPAVMILIAVNCFVWSAVLRSLLLLVAGSVLLIAFFYLR